MSSEQQNNNKNIGRKIIKNNRRILNNSNNFNNKNFYFLLINLLIFTKIVYSTEEVNTKIENNEISSDSCDIHANDSLHALMDRICELCHDMYSHQQPNMRADCRSNCFRSNNFKRCLRLFKPKGRNTSQRHKMRFLEESLQSYLIV